MALHPCPKCDTRISEYAALCPECGERTPFAGIVAPFPCPECESLLTKIPPNGCCPNCGIPLLRTDGTYAKSVSIQRDSNSEPNIAGPLIRFAVNGAFTIYYTESSSRPLRQHLELFADCGHETNAGFYQGRYDIEGVSVTLHFEIPDKSIGIGGRVDGTGTVLPDGTLKMQYAFTNNNGVTHQRRDLYRFVRDPIV
ncbi:MAG: polymerase large subunit [Planctomycetota bacterium]